MAIPNYQRPPWSGMRWVEGLRRIMGISKPEPAKPRERTYAEYLQGSLGCVAPGTASGHTVGRQKMEEALARFARDSNAFYLPNDGGYNWYTKGDKQPHILFMGSGVDLYQSDFQPTEPMNVPQMNRSNVEVLIGGRTVLATVYRLPMSCESTVTFQGGFNIRISDAAVDLCEKVKGFMWWDKIVVAAFFLFRQDVRNEIYRATERKRAGSLWNTGGEGGQSESPLSAEVKLLEEKCERMEITVKERNAELSKLAEESRRLRASEAGHRVKMLGDQCYALRMDNNHLVLDLAQAEEDNNALEVRVKQLEDEVITKSVCLVGLKNEIESQAIRITNQAGEISTLRGILNDSDARRLAAEEACRLKNVRIHELQKAQPNEIRESRLANFRKDVREAGEWYIPEGGLRVSRLELVRDIGETVDELEVNQLGFSSIGMRRILAAIVGKIVRYVETGTNGRSQPTDSAEERVL